MKARSALMCVSLMALVVVLAGPGGVACGGSSTTGATWPNGEIEATEFQGVALTPIADQRTRALRGPYGIDRDTYTLVIDGLVQNELALSYADLQSYGQVSWLMDLNCVEGWSFTAKWTGPRLGDILDDAGVDPEAVIAIFHTRDVGSGYTSLDLDYIYDNDIILALKLNDITLPKERGFPFQVVAKNKYGYKWAKWVIEIELSSDADFRGFWETEGYYNNDADIEGPAVQE